MGGKLLIDKHESLMTIILSNPGKKNAISYQMWKELNSVFLDLLVDSELRLLIIRGEGDDFSSGADISEFDDLRSGKHKEAYDDIIKNVLKNLSRLPVPVIASIKGVCYGGGFSLALNCDFRIAEDDALFCLPVSRRGLGYPKEQLQVISSVIGVTNAKDLLFTGRVVAYEEAKAMGMISTLNNSLNNPLKTYVTMILENAPLSIQAIKSGFQELSGIQDQQLSHEQRNRICSESYDYQEATKAFYEKRKPLFRGK